ncbi:MAG: diacylglycerol kinase family protein [Eubacteriales bacterium]|nr:diacylglycerol kinase family protein [Eubacteriales bacterium]
MKYCFVINPAAGKRDRTQELKVEIAAVMDSKGIAYSILTTGKPMEAVDLVRSAVEESRSRGEEIRIVACGGDGTLNEAVCGAAGYANAAVTHFPTGSGNDFIKLFGNGRNRFNDLAAIFDSEESEIDLIEINGRYCVNICSVGLDARISSEMARYKKIPLLSGQGAYYASVAVNIIKGIHKPMKIRIDEKTENGNPGLRTGSGDHGMAGAEAGDDSEGYGSIKDLSNSYTLVCACNGRYYGSGFNPVPEAMPDDGVIDVLVVDKCSRLKVAALINTYKNGGYAKLPELIHHYRCREMSVETPSEVAVNIDGETIRARRIDIKISETRMRFFYPRGAKW